jgi:hypothetical protein
MKIILRVVDDNAAQNKYTMFFKHPGNGKQTALPGILKQFRAIMTLAKTPGS